LSSAGVSFYDIEDTRGLADLVERLRDADGAERTPPSAAEFERAVVAELSEGAPAPR
jgi:hypothetical protein